MANTKITALPENTTPVSTDIVPIVDDPAGTPASQKITVANLSKAVSPEGTNVLSTGEVGGSKFLREDGDGTSSWQAIPGGGDMLTSTYDPNTVSGDAFSAANHSMARISGSTYSTVQHLQDIFHSTGVSTGGGITDDADGTITVAAGTGLVRATDSAVAPILWTDWAAEAGVNVTLTDNSMNYVYVQYNAGSPNVIATVSKRTDENTNILLGTVYRVGTTLHITNTAKPLVGDHALKMISRLKATMPYARESGGIVSAVGTRNIAVTAGTWWHGLTQFSTTSLDTSVAGTFRYFYRDGIGGWTEVTAQTQIDNTQYDNNSGTLATLSNNKYGVHWVYLGQDSDYYVLYGQGDYTLSEAENADAPGSTPPHFAENHAKLLAKIVILKSATAFTSVVSAFDTLLNTGTAQDHGSLSGLGDDDHTQYVLADGTRTLTNATLVNPALGTPASGVMTNVTGTAASLTAGNATQASALKSATTTVNVDSATAPSSGQVLTATGSTAATWQTPAGGGGGQATYDYIIGATGDYATLNAWYADAPADGDRLFIDGDHTLTANLTMTHSDIYIHGTRESTVTLSTFLLRMGPRGTLDGITIGKDSTGILLSQNTHVKLSNLYINTTTTSGYAIQTTANHNIIENINISTATSGITQQVYIGGDYSILNNVTLECVSGASGAPQITSVGDYCTISNITMKYTTGVANSEGFELKGIRNTLTNLVVLGEVATALLLDSSYCSVSNCNLNMTYSGSTGIYIGTANATITGCTVNGPINGIGIKVSNSQVCITGNSIRCASTTGSTGIQVNAGNDNTLIVGNIISNCATAVSIASSTCDNTVVTSNSIFGNTADITDSGTGTLLQTATDSDPLNKIT